MQDYDLIDEELIRSAGVVRPTSRKLRRRVLRAAKQAERRSQRRRRILVAASFLLPLALLCGWLQSIGSGAASSPVTAETQNDETTSEPLKAGAGPDANIWNQVDSSLRKRWQRSKTISSGMY
jgi:hypothetical protein